MTRRPRAGPRGARAPRPIGEQAPASDPIDDAVVAIENRPEASDGSDEPVSVGAEARVVMPRTTGGAGSWLRWPNSTVDRSDPSH